ncbi:hypothetical protein GCM10027346_41690 [Hymenobacter seoulensis]
MPESIYTPDTFHVTKIHYKINIIIGLVAKVQYGPMNGPKYLSGVHPIVWLTGVYT